MKKLYAFLAALFMSFTVNAQIINIPDANFKNALVNTNCVDSNGDNTLDSDADFNNDGEISVVEAESLTRIYISNQNIASLEGIQAFINLTSLEVSFNQLTSLDIGALNDLEWLHVNYNSFTSTDNIIFPANPNNSWFGLNINNNLLTSINNLPSNLTDLNCNDNPITSLDISAFNMYELWLINTPNLTSLVLSPSLFELRLDNVGLTELDLSESQDFHIFDCRNNPNLTYVKLGPGFQADNGGCHSINNNPVLETISFKNGFTNYHDYMYGCYNICNNPNLTFVCADEGEIENHSYQVFEGEWITVVADGVQQMIDDCGYTNVAVSPYCTFNPGGEIYFIEGQTKLDINNNGCDLNDTFYPNLNFEIANGSDTRNFISNGSGDYTIPVGEGTYILTPILENPDYFSVTPSNINLDFPSDVSPYIQDFCITPNGEFNDLEVTIIPINLARPGFDSNYKIIYKNKGTTSLSGEIIFGFQDEVMEFISSIPANESGLTDLLSWSFTDLASFESREIDVTMNLNSPMETPALNDGDVLTFNTSISSSETDETPDDNTFELHQTVVNSFDPNDKTCLEGSTITPEQVGEFVHYMIRFENTGSAEAVNIVVKDDIDRTKYDLSSLVPLHSSHDYVARIKDNASNYYVEFIFEGINLPFDDANNDGYIVFKIRTLDTLVLNDTFENDAEIYFDFNFPIITNNEQTTVAVLSTEDFALANTNVVLYPNPTTHVLHLESKQAIKHLSIYDISGRQIQDIAIIGSKTELEVSTEALSTGTYFVKIKTESSELVKKFIKD